MKAHQSSAESLWPIVSEFYELDGSRMHLARSCTNTVFLLPGDSAVKIDTDLATRVSNNLEFEAKVLVALDPQLQKIPPPIKLPRVLDFDLLDHKQYKNLSMARFSWVEGEFLDWDKLDELSHTEKTAIGQQAAETMYWLSQSLTIEGYKQEQLDQLANSRYATRWIEGISNYQDTIPRNLRRLRFLVNLISRHKEVLLNPPEPIIGHGDWRPPNMALQKNNNGEYYLSGLIDFSQTYVSSAEKEIGRLTYFSYTVGNACAKHFENLSQKKLDKTLLKLWTVIPGVFSLARRSVGMPPTFATPAGFRKTKKVIMHNFTEFDWSELDTLEPPYIHLGASLLPARPALLW